MRTQQHAPPLHKRWYPTDPRIKRCCSWADGELPDITYWRIHSGLLWFFCWKHAGPAREAEDDSAIRTAAMGQTIPDVVMRHMFRHQPHKQPGVH